jgi:hypothetical protein
VFAGQLVIIDGEAVVCFFDRNHPIIALLMFPVALFALNQRLARFCRQTVPKTIQEMQTFSWDSKAAQRGEEKPLKIHDHGPDALRYFAKTEVPYWRLGWGNH